MTMTTLIKKAFNWGGFLTVSKVLVHDHHGGCVEVYGTDMVLAPS